MDKNIESTYGAHIPSLHAKKTYASAQNECHKLHLRMTNNTRTEMSPKTLMKAHSPKAWAHMFSDWAPISNAVVHTFNSSHSDSNQGEIYSGEAADRAGHFVGQYFGFALGREFEPYLNYWAIHGGKGFTLGRQLLAELSTIRKWKRKFSVLAKNKIKLLWWLRIILKLVT